MKILFFCAFHPFLISPQNSEYFEYRHIGSKKKMSPCRMPKTKSPAPPAATKPIVLYNHFGVCRGGGGLPPPPPLGSGPDQARPVGEMEVGKPLLCLSFTFLIVPSLYPSFLNFAISPQILPS